jgi:hypothetical protein
MRETRPSIDTYYQSYHLLLKGDPFGSSDQRSWILRHNFVMGMTVIRRELFDRHGAFDESLLTSEDWDLWIRFILAGERVGLAPEPLAYYRTRADSLSGDPLRMNLDSLVVVERAVARLGAREVRGLGIPLLLRAIHAAALGDTRRASVFSTAAARDPTLRLTTRLKARAFAAMPGIGGRIQRWRSWRGQPVGPGTSE